MNNTRDLVEQILIAIVRKQFRTRHINGVCVSGPVRSAVATLREWRASGKIQ